MKIGIIGTGNMGRILIEALLDSKSVFPSEMMVINRTITKALQLKNEYNTLRVTENIYELALFSDLIFICVKPKDLYTVLKQIKPMLTSQHCVISITSPVSVQQLDSILSCSTVRWIPSITNRALAGVSLLTFGVNCSEEWKSKVFVLAEKISVPLEIENKITRVSSDIVSCGPAFFSYLAQAFIQAATKSTGIDQKTATILTEKMLVGLGELLKKEYYSLPTLQKKVCVKGGITGEGIKVMEQELGDMFIHLFEATHKKFEDEIKVIEGQFGVPY
ncbi:late competence protein ComER [Peribacillus tepidiphilus]|uniref:late competence protein ComER n=1 Tax=Peribacillus tepidiphilus TaxID=2652445 RepID=UPI0035B51012